jgi:UDP-N-acetylmuramate dehydrogenase
MNLASDIKTRFPDLQIRENQLLSSVTTFRLGGPCPLLIDNPPADLLPALIQILNERQTQFLIIGQGSNLIISDAGLDLAVIRFCSETPKIKAQDDHVIVSGDTLLEDFSRIAVEQSLGDLSYCTGIPGTVGGGIAGNAGAFGRQIGDHLVSVEMVGLGGSIQTLSHSELEFSYRHSRLKQTGEIVLSATFELPQEKPEVLKAERLRILDFRAEHHPDWHETPCAGSVFKNLEPTSAVERRKAAGRVLEEAGAKEMSEGGATVFQKHANMIIGGPNCTAQNVHNLCKRMQQAVFEQSGTKLVPEVRFLGDFAN